MAAKHLGNINGQKVIEYGIFFGGWVTNFNPIFGEGSQISILSDSDRLKFQTLPQIYHTLLKCNITVIDTGIIALKDNSRGCKASL